MEVKLVFNDETRQYEVWSRNKIILETDDVVEAFAMFEDLVDERRRYE